MQVTHQLRVHAAKLSTSFWTALFFVLLTMSTLAQPTEAKKIIKIAAPKVLSMGLIAIAETEKLFSKHGQNVQVVWTATGKEASQLLFENKVDLAAAYDSVVVQNHLNNQPQRIFSRLHSAKHNTAIVAHRNRGIIEPKKLRGRKIGVTSKTNAHFFLKSFLETNLVRLSSIHVKSGEPEKIVADFNAGKLDAISIWEPYISELRSNQELNIEVFYADPFIENSMLFGKSDTLPTLSSQVRSILTALMEASANIEKQPDASLMKILDKIGVEDGEFIRTSWKKQTLDLSVTNLLLGQLNFQKDWILTENKKSGNDDRRLLSEFDLSILRELSPYLVTVQDSVL